MEIEEGVIEKASKRKALVRIQPSSACASCESRGTCDITSDKKRMMIEVANDLQAKIGDRVQISMPEGSLLKLSFLVYFLPIVALIFGAVLGARVGPVFNLESTSTSIIGGGLAVGLVLFALKWFDRRSDAKDRYYPRMTRIIVSAKPPSPADSR
jgi:sigma-E factor negative regulatory protein RseC